MAGRFSRRLRAWAKAQQIPVVDCPPGERKHEIAEEYLTTHSVQCGLFLVLVSRSPALAWDIQMSGTGKIGNIQRKEPRPYVNHYHFHILDPDWGHITIKMSGHTIHIDGELYRCSCNPFPFGQFHTTIASGNHRQQQWSDEADLVHVIQGAVELASLLPGWVVLFNGSQAAGASIPAHRHYQVFKIDDSQRPFPLQQALVRKKQEQTKECIAVVGGKGYPVTCFRLAAEPRTIVQRATDIALQWRSFGRALSENVIATVEDGCVCLYYVPRDAYSYAAGFSGAIACLEILGEFIFSGEQDIRALSGGAVDYMWLHDVLSSISPAAAVSLVERVSQRG